MISAYDVVLVPFPFVERRQTKQRPALVVSSRRLDELDLLWLAMITTQGEAGRPGDCPIRDLGAAGLPAASWLRASKITTVEAGAVLRTLGRLSLEDQGEAGLVLAACAGW